MHCRCADDILEWLWLFQSCTRTAFSRRVSQLPVDAPTGGGPPRLAARRFLVVGVRHGHVVGVVALPTSPNAQAPAGGDTCRRTVMCDPQPSTVCGPRLWPLHGALYKRCQGYTLPWDV